MWKSVLAGTAALAIAGTSLVYAQQRNDDGPRGRNHAPKITQEDRAAFNDARIAALKAGLRLTPEQDKNWPAFETALRDIAKSRMDRRVERREEPRAGDPVERLRRQAEMLSTAGANLKKLADAQEPLYQSLDDSQKKRFQLLANVLTGHNKHFAQMRKHHRHEMRSNDRDRRHDRGDDRRGQDHERGSNDRGGDNTTGRGMSERL